MGLDVRLSASASDGILLPVSEDVEAQEVAGTIDGVAGRQSIAHAQTSRLAGSDAGGVGAVS